MVTLYRPQPDGSTRYLTFTDRQGNLFGYLTLTVTEGRDFFLTRERHHTYDSEGELQQALRKMIDRRLRRGYSVLYSWFGDSRYTAVERRIERSLEDDTVRHGNG